MALNRAKCYHKPKGRVWSLAGIWRMQKNQWSGGWVWASSKHGTDTEKARDAKLELTAGLKNWWTEEDLSGLVGWWQSRISWRYGGKNVRPRNTRMEMYAGHVACCRWWVTLSMCRRDRETDGQTSDRYITLSARLGQRSKDHRNRNSRR